MLSDTAIVSDLNQIVDLRAGSDDGAPGLRPVDARVRADFYVVFEYHVSNLRNPLRPSVHEGPAKPVAADHAARMQDDPVADDATGHKARVGLDPDRAAEGDVIAIYSPGPNTLAPPTRAG